MFYIISNLILLIFSSYFSLRFIWPLNLSLPIKLGCFFIIFIIAVHATIIEFGTIQLPDKVQLIPAWCIIVIVLASLLAFCADSINIFMRLFGVPFVSTKFMPIILLMTCLTCTYGMYQALRVPPIKNVNIQFNDLPKELEGLRIAHMSDTHIGRFFRKEWLNESIDKVLAAKPDLIAITGDSIDAPFAEIKDDTTPFTRLHAPLGVYFVAGNHEYINDYNPWIKYFRSLTNLNVLENAHKTIKIGDINLNIIGLTDPAARRFKHLPPSAELALAGLSRKSEKQFSLLLSHQPANVENAKTNANLQLSGHTHGGILWFIKGIVARSNAGYVSGLYESNENPLTKIFVSNGMAIWEGFPMRLGIDSEIVIITLTK